MLDKRMRAASREFVPKARFVIDEDGIFVRWKIILPIETLIDILSFFSRRILSKRMRLVNRQFMRISNENIHSLGTVFNLIVSTSYRYGWATRVQDCILDYVRDFIELHCCMPSEVRRLHNHQADPEPSSFIPGSRDRWKATELFWYREPKLTPAEFYRFMQTNRCVRFANLKFENVQEECVIEFFKYLIETTEMFVQQPLDGEGSRKKGVFEEHDSRNVDLDEFIPVKSLE